MNDIEIVEQYIDSFKNQNVPGMCRMYAPEVVFFDPLADLIRGDEVEARWRLFFEDASQCIITAADVVDEEDGYFTCKWVASFVHSESGKPVVLKATSNFKIEHGRIAEQSDGFSLHQYCIQAYGLVAYLIGWNSLYQRARKNEFRRRLLQLV